MTKNLFLQNVQEIFEGYYLQKIKVNQDYFSWGRDKRHIVDDSEDVTFNKRGNIFRRTVKKIYKSLHFKFAWWTYKITGNVHILIPKKYHKFHEAYSLMTDKKSKDLFCELLLIKAYGEGSVGVSTFTEDFIDNYEQCSKQLLASNSKLEIYDWTLRQTSINNGLQKIYTVPTMLNLIKTDRLYNYCGTDKKVGVEPGDIVIDAGVGWGDSCLHLASISGDSPGGHLYAFDILDSAFSALDKQRELNPEVGKITSVKKALFDKDDIDFFVTKPGPGAQIVDFQTNYRVSTITIDSFVATENFKAVNFIKMDIEGAELRALKGASNTIASFKPKLAISVYHLWNDLYEIPLYINSVRNDYSFYLDCTTGFGGEAVLYCI